MPLHRRGSEVETMVLHHKVRVFVFRYEEQQPHFLLLRHQPRLESRLGPVHGTVGMGEQLQEAVLREVTEETGLQHPSHLIDLEHFERLCFGDEGVVEWEFGYQTLGHGSVIVPGPQVAETIWANFDRAFRSLEFSQDREALIRLQMRLRA
ncbi:MAG: hypothetical protein CSA62_12395 [Planctomycetota bacterium]|nr:MAG: hypothetical protein CSA62_12395 [Planctomycetota bacterium]